MKRPTKQFLDDLLEDSGSPKFRSEVMAKTLGSAQRRKRIRHFTITFGGIVAAGILAFTFRESSQKNASNLTHGPTLNTAQHSSLNISQIGNIEANSPLILVETTESAHPKEIDDKELVTLLSTEPVALVRYPSGRAELISLNQ